MALAPPTPEDEYAAGWSRTPNRVAYDAAVAWIGRETKGNPMRIPQDRRRDNQQWMMDWMVKTTGRVINFEYDDREVPSHVRNYAQIPRAMAKMGAAKERMADAAAAAGHNRTALQTYYAAIRNYHTAQHAIFQDDSPPKIEYHARLLQCFDRIMDLAEYPIERVEVPWEGQEIQGNLHLIEGKPKAPCVIFVPGMDMVKEWVPDPLNNVFTSRGMHCLSIDGPGQGTSNMRKIRVTDDNFEHAVSAVIDYLETRPEIDSDRIALMGVSMGSYWGARSAAYDDRIKATAVAMSCLGDKTAIFEQSSPRFKQIFMYMAGMSDEDEFDAMAAKMHTRGYGGKIKNPFLVVTGEYDPLAPVEDAEEFFDELAGPKELWTLADFYHVIWDPPHFGSISAHNHMADWISDALAGKLASSHAEYRYFGPNDLGPYTEASDRRASTDPLMGGGSGTVPEATDAAPV